MRRQDKMAKICYMAAWSMIFLLAAYILIKGGIVFGTENRFQMVEEIRNYAISEYSKYIAKDTLPLLPYTLYKPEKEEEKQRVSRYLAYLYPFRSMMLAIKTVDTTAETTAQFKTILFTDKVNSNTMPSGTIGFIFGESYYEDDETEDDDAEETLAVGNSNSKLIAQLKKNKNTSFLVKNFYIVDSTTSIDKSFFQVDKLLAKDFTIKKNAEEPQILIYHTHACSEGFSDSREGKQEDTVVGVGTKLAKILSEQYGFNVIHDESQYDMVNGSIDRNKAYTAAMVHVKKILKENPSIKVIIDIHRDGVASTKKDAVLINGKKTARIMLFNGLSRNQNGPIDYLYNPNLQANLAFSLQVKLAAMEQYPNFSKPIYLKGYRYNMDICQRFLLIELGNQNNTVEEAKNAMEPLADILNQVLSKK